MVERLALTDADCVIPWTQVGARPKPLPVWIYISNVNIGLAGGKLDIEVDGT